MPRTAIDQQVRRFLDVLLAADDDALTELTTSDVVDRSPGDFASGRQGLREHQQFLAALLGPCESSVEDIIVDADRAVAFWTLLGTHVGQFLGLAPTGRTLRIPIVSTLRLRDGRISEYRGRPDVWSALAQMGAAVSLPSHPGTED